MIIEPFEYMEYVEVGNGWNFTIDKDAPEYVKKEFFEWVEAIEIMSITKRTKRSISV